MSLSVLTGPQPGYQVPWRGGCGGGVGGSSAVCVLCVCVTVQPRSGGRGLDRPEQLKISRNTYVPHRPCVGVSLGTLLPLISPRRDVHAPLSLCAWIGLNTRCESHSKTQSPMRESLNFMSIIFRTSYAVCPGPGACPISIHKSTRPLARPLHPRPTYLQPPYRPPIITPSFPSLLMCTPPPVHAPPYPLFSCFNATSYSIYVLLRALCSGPLSSNSAMLSCTYVQSYESQKQRQRWTNPISD